MTGPRKRACTVDCPGRGRCLERPLQPCTGFAASIGRSATGGRRYRTQGFRCLHAVRSQGRGPAPMGFLVDLPWERSREPIVIAPVGLPRGPAACATFAIVRSALGPERDVGPPGHLSLGGLLVTGAVSGRVGDLPTSLAAHAT